ncbi:ABC transporter substrate-binding protein [Candidatus Hydrogenedentota bacterium]
MYHTIVSDLSVESHIMNGNFKYALNVVGRRIRFPILVSVVVCGFMAGCETRSRGEKVHIRFQYEANRYQDAAFRHLAQKFESRNPEISIKCERVSGRNYQRKILMSMAAKVPPDVLMFEDEPFRQYAEKGVFTPLSSYIERDNYDLSDFWEIGLDNFRYKEKLYGFPKNTVINIVYYNKNLFDRAGLDYPTDDWTWDEFLELAKKLTLDVDGDGRIDQVGTTINAWWPMWLTWIWGNGGAILNEERTKCMLTTPESREAVQFLVDMRNKWNVTPSPEQLSANLGNIGQTFAIGNIAMMEGGPSTAKKYKEEIKTFEWGMVESPIGKAGRFARFTNAAFLMSSQTSHPEESWRFLKFLGSEEAGHVLLTEGGDIIPPRKSVAGSKEFMSKDNPWDAELLLKTLGRARLQPITTRHKYIDEMSDRRRTSHDTNS